MRLRVAAASRRNHIMDLFTPDTLLPAQYFAEYSRDGGTRRERLLMLAVLRDAVECYQKFALTRDPRGRILFTDAAKWIESDDREWAFSYENICEVLGLDPAYVRRGLSKWRQQKTPAMRRSPRVVSLFERRLMERDLRSAPASDDTDGAR
jgi:hypothetical protein